MVSIEIKKEGVSALVQEDYGYYSPSEKRAAAKSEAKVKVVAVEWLMAVEQAARRATAFVAETIATSCNVVAITDDFDQAVISQCV